MVGRKANKKGWRGQTGIVLGGGETVRGQVEVNQESLTPPAEGVFGNA